MVGLQVPELSRRRARRSDQRKNVAEVVLLAEHVETDTMPR
jgi:hypothetical protein